MKFNDLVQIAEAPGRPSFTTPMLPRPTVPNSGRLATAAKAGASLLGKGVKTALFNPAAATAAINAFRQGGAQQGAATLTKGFGNEMNRQTMQAMSNYYSKLDFPRGFPVKGSKFEVTDSHKMLYVGEVTNVQPAGDVDTLTVVTKPLAIAGAAAGVRSRIYVIEINKKERAYRCINKYYVSDINSYGQYVKNEQESGHIPNITFETTANHPEGAFCLSPNKTYTFHVWCNTVPGLTVGSKITARDVQGQDISGVITRIIKMDDGHGGRQDAYEVEANFNRP